MTEKCFETQAYYIFSCDFPSFRAQYCEIHSVNVINNEL